MFKRSRDDGERAFAKHKIIVRIASFPSELESTSLLSSSSFFDTFLFQQADFNPQNTVELYELTKCPSSDPSWPFKPSLVPG